MSYKLRKEVYRGSALVFVFYESGVSKYQIQYRIAGKSKWPVRTLSAKKTKITLKKLKAGKKYDIRVRAYAKGAGYGAYGKVKKSPKVK